MHAIGLYKEGGSVTAVHLASTAFGVRKAGSFTLSWGMGAVGASAELRDYMAVSAPGAAVALAMPRRASISRVFEMPAPSAEAAARAVSFELDRQLPFSPDECLYGYETTRKGRRMYRVALSAARKDEGLMEVLAGLEDIRVVSWHTAFHSALYSRGMIGEKGAAGLVAFDAEGASVEVFSDAVPVYSRSLKAPVSGLAREVERALSGFAPPKGLPEVFRVVSGEGLEGVIGERPAGEGMRFEPCGGEGFSPGYAAAFGAALAALGRARYGAVLLSRRKKRGRLSKFVNIPYLSAAAAALFAAVFSSYLAQDWLALKAMDAQAARVRAEKELVEGGLERFRGLEERISALREIDLGTGAPVLDVLKELSAVLPGDAWLTGLVFEKGAVTVEGFSERASLLILKMGQSTLMKEVEFDGPVLKAEGGKERFRIRFRTVRPDPAREGAGGA